jgi:hypothetical protein
MAFQTILKEKNTPMKKNSAVTKMWKCALMGIKSLGQATTPYIV